MDIGLQIKDGTYILKESIMINSSRRTSIAVQISTLILLPLSLLATKPSHASDWAGVYAGLSVGARDLDADWKTQQAYAPPGFAIPFTSDPSASFDSTDFRGAGYLGYNWQVNPLWVVGLEADLGYANNEDKLNDRIPGLGTSGSSPSSYTEIEAEQDASIRLRGGYLIRPNIMIFGTAGVAELKIKESVTCPADTNVCNPAVGIQSFSKSKTMTGWTVGAGVETAFGDNWLARIEYRYADYGDYKLRAISPSISTYGADTKIDTKTQMINVGVAYKF